MTADICRGKESEIGYYTSFDGDFRIEPPLTPAHRAYIAAFCSTRRQKSSSEATASLPDPLREAAGLPIGEDAGYYVAVDPSVFSNDAPAGQPGVYCDWSPSEDGAYLVPPDADSKFYEYVPWLCYLLEHFLVPWGYKVSGQVEWYGEERMDQGEIVVEDNVVNVREAIEVKWGELQEVWAPGREAPRALVV